jgi:DNA repair protein RecN (Recombination protein N)
VQAELSEAVSTLRRYADRVDLDPARLAEVERRMDAVMAMPANIACSRRNCRFAGRLAAAPGRARRICRSGRMQARVAAAGRYRKLAASIVGRSRKKLASKWARRSAR